MKVKFRQSGGIGGQVEGVDLTVSAMPDDDRKELQELIAGCDISGDFEDCSPDARDQLEFEIEIDDESGKRHFKFDETTIPDTCENLLQFLRRRSRWVPLD